MSGVLARFERLMEQAVEGSLRRVFATSLQPVQLAKAAARAMEEAQVVSIRGREVPNQYDLRLAPADVVRFSGYSASLVDQITTYLGEYARERDFRLVAPLHVTLVEDSTLGVGSVRARARFVDLPRPVQKEVEAAIEGTRRLRLADLASAQSSTALRPASALRLTDGAGLDYELETEAGVVRLGRATDNDVVIDSQRVSRYHAQLRWVPPSWLLYDLNSTNGTWLDDEPVQPDQPRSIALGRSIRLGDHELKV